MSAALSLNDILVRPDVWRGRLAEAGVPALSSGFPVLDAELPGGGWPRGALTEILVDGAGLGERGDERRNFELGVVTSDDVLLDAAQAYHREVLRTRGEMPEAVTQLLPRLRDPDYTKVFVVTLAEATPVHEAERLQADLARAGIRPFAWVIEQCLLASGTREPLLALRGECEIPFIRRVADELATRCALVPWLAAPPEGRAGLARLDAA